MLARLQIICPANNISEREYVIDTLVSFIGLSCDITFSSEVKDYYITAGNKNLVIEDHFWNDNQQEESYVSVGNIPKEMFSFTHLPGRVIPIVYGRNFLTHQGNHIVCGLDIFASAFFMLARWEECVLRKNGRCNEFDLFAVKNNIYQRPIVNEYCDLLISLLQKLGIQVPTCTKEVEIMLTHDVDRCYLSSFSRLLINVYKMALIDNNMKKAFVTLKRYLQYKKLFYNPFDSFDLLMTYSEKFGFKNSFYFKAVNESELGFTYNIEDKFVKDRIVDIKSRGHLVGFHPSENTFDNREQFAAELGRLRNSGGGGYCYYWRPKSWIALQRGVLLALGG